MPKAKQVEIIGHRARTSMSLIKSSRLGMARLEIVPEFIMLRTRIDKSPICAEYVP